MATFADSPPSEGSDLRWLIEHLKMYPNSDEKPLRSTYSENILRQRPNFTPQQARPPTPAMSTSPPSSSEASPVTPQTPQFEDNLNPFYGNQAVINQFKDFGPMDDACYFPSRPASLPPSFITGFVRRTFTDDLCLVDFTQALTALDYLKVLENRRKHEIVAAIQRLGLSVHTTHAEREDWLRTHPEISNWVSGIECDERKVEALYTQVYIGLRRWTLINELRLVPYNKANCIAMLNTLYPRMPQLPLPTPQLTPALLASQHTLFWKYIGAVELKGRAVLATIESQAQRPGDKNGWPVTHQTLEAYLTMANEIIKKCAAVTGPEIFQSKRSSGRADSAVSFGSEGRNRSGAQTATGFYQNQRLSAEKIKYASDTTNVNKPLPFSPGLPPTPGKRSASSTFERLAREIRRIKSRSADSKEHSQERSLEKRPSLQKMRSSSALGRNEMGKRGHSRGNSAERWLEEQEIEARRDILLREAMAKREREKQKENFAPGTEMAKGGNQITRRPLPPGSPAVMLGAGTNNAATMGRGCWDQRI